MADDELLGVEIDRDAVKVLHAATTGEVTYSANACVLGREIGCA
jgi:hypothetical protein